MGFTPLEGLVMATRYSLCAAEKYGARGVKVAARARPSTDGARLARWEAVQPAESFGKSIQA